MNNLSSTELKTLNELSRQRNRGVSLGTLLQSVVSALMDAYIAYKANKEAFE